MLESYVLALIVCAALSIIGYKMRSYPVIVVSSLGLVIVGLQMYSDGTADLLCLGLIIMLALAQPWIVPNKLR